MAHLKLEHSPHKIKEAYPHPSIKLPPSYNGATTLKTCHQPQLNKLLNPPDLQAFPRAGKHYGTYVQ
jgi:hypothetical protein